MPVPLIACRNKNTGAVGELPETALPHMTDWVPIEAEPTEKAWSAPADPKALDEKPAEVKPATASTTKSKAATTAADEKE